MKLLGIGSFSLLLAFSPACVPSTPQQCRAFFDLPSEQRHVEFRTFPVPKKLDVYLCAMKGEPPDLSLAADIADLGPGAIPAVVDKLKHSKSEVDQENLIYLLEVMSELRYLRGRNDVIGEVRDVIDSMKIRQMRYSSLERLRKIQINSGVKP